MYLIKTWTVLGWIIEVRHEATHNELPSLAILRCASVKLIDWFKENYWLPQSNHVQSLRIESTNNTILPEIGIKRDIEEKNKLSDYACLRLPKKWKITHPDELYPIGFKQKNR